MFLAPKTRQAVVYRGPNDLRLETVPVPRIGPGELLVEVAACGVCPTDLKKIQYGTVPPLRRKPAPPGSRTRTNSASPAVH
jgi:NADPH:quinone reductase-like Zn-dependent oxidoreductase